VGIDPGVALFRRGLVQLAEARLGKLERKLENHLRSLNIQPLHLALILTLHPFIGQAQRGSK